jgi:hypothetical protein
VPYEAVNVLESDHLRDGIKTYSDWPTIPQLYVKGEFVGGCDIVTEMFQSGELKQTMEQKGLQPATANVLALTPKEHRHDGRPGPDQSPLPARSRDRCGLPDRADLLSGCARPRDYSPRPITEAHGWGREVYGLAMAMQNLVWGIAQPFVGMLADKLGNDARHQGRRSSSTPPDWC